MPGMEFILGSLGTRGDVAPFLCLASELIARGHNVTVLSNENWATDVRAVGAAFHAIAPADPTQSGRDDRRFFLDMTLPAYRRAFEFVAQSLSRARPVLVYKSILLGLECAAERFCLPNVKIVLQPSAIKSVERPAWPLTQLVSGRFGEIAKTAIIPALYFLGEAAGGFRVHTNAFRRSVGVAAARFGRRRAPVEDGTIVMCPEWFAMPQSDWPPRTHCAGFCFYDRPRPDPTLESFISRHGAPVVFTPGTGVADVAPFFERAGRICELLGMPGVFLSPAADIGASRRLEATCVRDFADLSWLLPRSALLVHHGGIGTVAQALRAGIPQVIVPNRFDQPDNAMRVATLRLGAAVMSERVTIDEWCACIRTLLADEDVRSGLDRGSRDIRHWNASARAADVVERVAQDAHPRRMTAGVTPASAPSPDARAVRTGLDKAAPQWLVPP